MLALSKNSYYIFSKAMDYFLTSEEKEIKEIIRELFPEWKESGEKDPEPGNRRPSVEEEKKILRSWQENFPDILSGKKDRQGRRSLPRGFYFLNELAMIFPELSLKIAVHYYLFSQLLKLAEKPNEAIRQKLSASKINGEIQLNWGNHIFISPFFRINFNWGQFNFPEISQKSGKLSSLRLLVFPIAEAENVLMPEIEDMTRSKQKTINYFLLDKNILEICTLSRNEDLFPLRPLTLKIKEADYWLKKSADFSLKMREVKPIMADFYLILTACFCGWCQSLWPNFIKAKRAGFKSSSVEVRLSILVTELEKLKWQLRRWLAISSFSASPDYFEQVEKFSRQGLKLASGAWALYKQLKRQINPSGRRQNEA
ncbi:MAG: hypothetical protein JHC32_04505 [Candidatus Aminicenantes bacterium]|nr:hypothetical protein [Candidatus Aminicenantes bacterium]